MKRSARVLDGVHRGLQSQPLLRIHPGCFSRIQTEELGIEPVNIVEESTPAASNDSVFPNVVIVKGGHIKPISRYLSQDIEALAQDLPEVCLCIYASRKAASNAYNGNRLLLSVFGHGQYRKLVFSERD
jgi:hypothetical protein